MQKHWPKAKKDGKWFPGKKPSNQGGRPAQISMAQEQAIANKAMELKREFIPPTPEKVRAKLPAKTINKATSEPISDKTIWRIFKTMCCDEKEDDPWQFLPSPQQDCLTSEMKPKRVNTADHVMTVVVGWRNIQEPGYAGD